VELSLADEHATARVGAALAHALPAPSGLSLLLGLSGELGSGKTTLARGLLRALGVTGTIRSPTFTLIEPYVTAQGPVHHLDLFRLDPGGAALEALGYRDIRGSAGLVIVEWPERAGGALGPRDLDAMLAVQGQGRSLVVHAGTESGRSWLGRACASLEEYRVSS
jgi:tRNA threonylcarbamoyladenosine biosynthesis protein TsaE